MFVYQIGDISKIISLFIVLLVSAFFVGLIIPKRGGKKLINLNTSRYKALAIIGATVIGAECYIKLTGLAMHYFITLNSGTTESIGCALFETVTIFTMAIALVYLLLMRAFELGDKFEFKILS